MSVTELKTEVAVVNMKVTENHKMLSVLWDDFLENKNGNLAWINGKADIKATAETKKTFQ